MHPGAVGRLGVTHGQCLRHLRRAWEADGSVEAGFASDVEAELSIDCNYARALTGMAGAFYLASLGNSSDIYIYIYIIDDQFNDLYGVSINTY